MKKKIAALLIGVCMVATAAGCAGKGASSDDISISQYKGVTVDKVAAVKVTDEDVEAGLKSTQEANAIKNEVKDRAAKEGDTVVIDYVGKVDGVEFEGGSDKDTSLVIGEAGFIEGFDKGVIGHKAGETFDVPLKFPDDYQSEELKGKDAVFTMTLKSISTSTIPELTDDFVKSVSKDSKTVEEYKKEVKKEMEKSNAETAKSTLQQSVMEAVSKNSKVEKYPEDRVKDISGKITEQNTQMATYAGMEFADYLEQRYGMTEEIFKEQVKTAAKESVKQELALELIAKEENLKLTDKDYAKEMKTYAKTFGFESVDAMKEQVDEKELKMMIQQDKVKEWLADNCKQVEPKKEKTDTKETIDKEETK